jgi:hypothetical protein
MTAFSAGLESPRNAWYGTTMAWTVLLHQKYVGFVPIWRARIGLMKEAGVTIGVASLAHSPDANPALDAKNEGVIHCYYNE